jgi:hypothetical protein
VTPIDLGLALLPAKALHVHDGEPDHFHLGQGRLNVFELARLNNRDDQLHGSGAGDWGLGAASSRKLPQPTVFGTTDVRSLYGRSPKPPIPSPQHERRPGLGGLGGKPTQAIWGILLAPMVSAADHTEMRSHTPTCEKNALAWAGQAENPPKPRLGIRLAAAMILNCRPSVASTAPYDADLVLPEPRCDPHFGSDASAARRFALEKNVPARALPGGKERPSHVGTFGWLRCLQKMPQAWVGQAENPPKPRGDIRLAYETQTPLRHSV